MNRKDKRNIDRSEVESLDELFTQINEFANFPNYVFRGHADSDWLVESTLSRALKKISYSDKSELIKKHFEDFEFEIRGRRGANPKKLEENELWALGQHFGLHTPLLDWTYSPYVALFFALERMEQPVQGYRSLWALHLPDLDDINKFHSNKEEYKEKWEVSVVRPILDENNRLISQRGLFTKMGIGNDIETWVESGPDDIEWVTLYKINFPESVRDSALSLLSLMNINHSSLFPDLIGGARATNIKLEQTDYLIEKQKEFWKNEARGRS